MEKFTAFEGLLAAPHVLILVAYFHLAGPLEIHWLETSPPKRKRRWQQRDVSAGAASI
ncbi:hypothetical protein LR48_Vigan2347s000100 [Vigna angularis]|nr:hypothetical protein LR48_Vigan2347s000100 [Vigna angularis]